MANLAKRETPASSANRRSAFEDTLIRTRPDTRTPGLEVNAPIVGPNQSKAQVLAGILGVASDAAEQGVGLMSDAAIRQNKELSAQGALAEQSGKAMDPELAKKRAYAEGYYTSGAERTALEVATQARLAVQERLNNEDDPATPADITGILDQHFAAVGLDEQGRPRNLGSPKAALAMAKVFEQTRAEIMPAALTAIRNRQNAKLLDNLAFVAATKGLPELPPLAPSSSAVPTPLIPVDPDKAAMAPPDKPAENGAITGNVGSTNLLARMIPITAQSESGNRDRVGGKLVTSPAGAEGKMQVMPATARNPGYGIRPWDGKTDADRNRVGEELLGALLNKYQDPAKAWAAYNWDSSGTKVDQLVAKYGQDWLSHAPSETQAYVRKNLSALGEFTPPNAANITFQGPPSQALRPRYDFESLMAQVPQTIDRGTAKKELINGLIVYADQAGRPEILDGIWDSTRKDGTPSFTPEESLRIREAADAIRNKQRTAADRQRKDMWDANADQIMAAYVNGQTVTPQTIQQGVNSGKLDPQWGYSFLEHQDAEARQEAAAARQEARQAQAAADQETDMEVSSRIAARMAGDLRGATREDDQKLFENGDLGTGKKAIARLRQLRAAAAAGAQEVERSPEGAQWAGFINDTYKVTNLGSGGSLIAKARGGGATIAQHAAAVASYRAHIAAGDAPALAASKVLKEYPLTDNAAAQRKALEARRAELQAKQ